MGLIGAGANHYVFLHNGSVFIQHGLTVPVLIPRITDAVCVAARGSRIAIVRANAIFLIDLTTVSNKLRTPLVWQLVAILVS
jgi:hypothetical protein